MKPCRLKTTWCNKCDNIIWHDKCDCYAHIIIDEEGEEHEIYAKSGYFAALAYAEKSNTNGDYYLMDNSVEITVNGKKYKISAEPDVHYSADEIPNQPLP